MAHRASRRVPQGAQEEVIDHRRLTTVKEAAPSGLHLPILFGRPSSLRLDSGLPTPDDGLGGLDCAPSFVPVAPDISFGERPGNGSVHWSGELEPRDEPRDLRHHHPRWRQATSCAMALLARGTRRSKSSARSWHPLRKRRLERLIRCGLSCLSGRRRPRSRLRERGDSATRCGRT